MTAFLLMAKMFEKRALKMLNMAGLEVFQPPQVYKYQGTRCAAITKRLS